MGVNYNLQTYFEGVEADRLQRDRFSRFAC